MMLLIQCSGIIPCGAQGNHAELGKEPEALYMHPHFDHLPSPMMMFLNDSAWLELSSVFPTSQALTVSVSLPSCITS